MTTKNAPGTVQPSDEAHRPGAVVVLDDAMLRFTAWDRPWLFRGEVEGWLADTAARAVFDELWSRASEFLRSSVADPATAVHATEQALRALYPRLRPAAVTALVRAASYAWR